MVQNNDTGDFAVPTKTCGHGHMQLRRVKVGQVVEAESGLVAVNAFYLLISIPGPESPERKVGLFRRREQPQPGRCRGARESSFRRSHDTGGVLGKARGLSLFRSKETLLSFGYFVEAAESFFVRLSHAIILH